MRPSRAWRTNRMTGCSSGGWQSTGVVAAYRWFRPVRFVLAFCMSSAIGTHGLETMMNTATAKTFSGSAVQSKKLIAALALAAGLGIVFLIGFANSSTLHNAAHDYRHSMAFPCH